MNTFVVLQCNSSICGALITWLASTARLSYAACAFVGNDSVQSKYALINFDPVAVSVGPLDVHWYGIMYLLAFLSFWVIGNRMAIARTWYGWSKEQVSDVLFYGMLVKLDNSVIR